MSAGRPRENNFNCEIPREDVARTGKSWPLPPRYSCEGYKCLIVGRMHSAFTRPCTTPEGACRLDNDALASPQPFLKAAMQARWRVQAASRSSGPYCRRGIAACSEVPVQRRVNAGQAKAPLPTHQAQPRPASLLARQSNAVLSQQALALY